MTDKTEETSWYAMRVFMNKVAQCRDLFNTYNNVLKGLNEPMPHFPDAIKGGVMEYYAPFVKETYTNNRGKEVVFERPFIPSLFFMRSSVTQAECLEESLPGKARLYRHQTEKGYCPIAIPLRQMEMFIKATQYADDDLDIFEDDAFWMKKGVRVRVTGGKFEGLEGEIKRIDGDHRLVVTVEGICAVATAYIPKCYLEKIE